MSLVRPAWLTVAGFRQPVRRRTYVVLVALVVVAVLASSVGRGHWLGQAIGVAIVGLVALLAARLAGVAGAVADLVEQEQRRRRAPRPADPAVASTELRVELGSLAERVAELGSLVERVAELERVRAVPDTDISRLEARCVVLQDRLDALSDRLADPAR